METSGCSIITKAFDIENWNYSVKRYDEKEKNIFTINFTFKSRGKLECKIHIFDNGICDMDMTLPLSCPSEYRMMLSYYFAKTNFNKRYATYRLDIDDGEIQYSYSFEITSSINSEEFLRIFKRTKNGAMDDDEFNEIKRFCEGRFTKEELAIISKASTLMERNKAETPSQVETTAKPLQTNKKTSGSNKYKIQF